MHSEHLKELVKNQTKTIKYLVQRWEFLSYQTQITELKKEIENPLFWQHPNQIAITKEYKRLGSIEKKIQEMEQKNKDISDLLEIPALEKELLMEISKEIQEQEKTIQQLHITLLLNKLTDKKNCYLDINAGAGGTEAQDWAAMLLRMYIRFCEEQKFHYSLIDQLPGEEAGIKSATLFIQGEYINGLLESENGIHRLVRVSPFDANKKRHTSFAAVGITPEIEDIEIKINAQDLRIDTFRAGGAGGQHVNKTDSAVRITHIPTNIVVQCQNERSQLQNKETAMKMLRARLYKKEQEERLDKFNAVERKKIEWGSQIRSYILHPYKMVKDHQTEIENGQPEKTLDGEIIPFIEKYLLQRK